MVREHKFLAVDLGAESGRGEIVTLGDSHIHMEEIHRFPNRPVRLAGTIYWDFPSLMAEIYHALRVCAQRQIPIEGISVDTWGVDFGLLDRRGSLVGNPVAYRDSRTDRIHEYSDPVMSRQEIFAATGCEPWAIASLFQLLAMQRDKWPALECGKTFLNMPDLIQYFLTGVPACEMSIASTSALMGIDGKWSHEILSRFKLPREMFGKLIEPATVLGPLSESVRSQTGVGEVPVIATCGHDTSAAVAAIGAQGDDWAYLSCGTWSILGSLVAKPITTEKCLSCGFANEYTIGGWYLARNISGLWLVQQLRAKWNRPDAPLDYETLTGEAAAATAESLIDAADPSLMSPQDMEESLRALIRAKGGKQPEDRGELTRCVLESLALEYDKRLNMLGELTGKKPSAIYMVGGGIKNQLLCQLTANACGLPIYAGADQCTAAGNALGQALALGVLKTPADIRKVMANSFPNALYQPKDQPAWDKKRAQYAKIAK